MNENNSQYRWRWMLVDALAHGLKYWPCRIKKSENKESSYSVGLADKLTAENGDLIALADKVYNEYNVKKDYENRQKLIQVRNKLEMQKGKAEKELEKFNKLFLSFTKEEQRKILTTPRFDITAYSFVDRLLNNPDKISFEEYKSTLPALSIPFEDFWLEWVATESEGEFKFATRVRKIRTSDTGQSIMLETFIDFPPKASNTDVPTCLLVDADLELDNQYKVIELKTNENTIALFLPVIHSLALLTCRNVQTIEVPPSRQIRRQVERTHGVTMCSYRVIKIKHMRTKRVGKTTEVTAEDDKTSSRAFSICRGHFKTYDDKGLFGKLKGTWWWDDHAVGDPSLGIIIKDYVMEKGA